MQYRPAWLGAFTCVG